MQNLKSKISRYMTIITVGIISVIIVVSFLVSMLSAQSNARKEAKYLLKQIEQLFEENQQDLSEVKEELFNDFSLLRINEGVDYLAIDAKTETVIGATDSTLVGKDVSQTGLKMSKNIKDKDGFHARYGE